MYHNKRFQFSGILEHSEQPSLFLFVKTYPYIRLTQSNFSGSVYLAVVVSLSADFAGVYGYNITDILLYSHPVSCWIGGTVKSPRSWYFLTVEGWVLATYLIISLMHFAITWSVSCKVLWILVAIVTVFSTSSMSHQATKKKVIHTTRDTDT